MLERRCYRAAAAITTPTRGLVEALDAVPQAHGKVVWMAPAVDLDRFQPGPPPADGGALRVLYAGTVGMAQGLDTLLDAAEWLGPDKLRLTIAGGGAEAPGLAQRAEALPGVQMAGIVPFEAVPGLYALHDAAVVLLRDSIPGDGELAVFLVGFERANSRTDHHAIRSRRRERNRKVEEIFGRKTKGLDCANAVSACVAIFEDGIAAFFALLQSVKRGIQSIRQRGIARFDREREISSVEVARFHQFDQCLSIFGFVIS